jgi:chlorosome envelope protein H
MISNLNETVNSGQVKNLFDNISAGISQLAGGIFPQGMPPMFMGSGGEEKRKVVQQIPVMHAGSKPPAEPAPAPAAPKSEPEA